MANIVELLRAEHREFGPKIERLRENADLMFLEPGGEVAKDVEESFLFINWELIPHAKAEERVLYPAMEKVLGKPTATEMMVMDHQEILQLADELGALRPAMLTDELTHEERKHFRRLFYSLYALIKLHFRKEEEIVIPLLDRYLSEDEASKLAAAMKDAAESVRPRAG